MQWINCWATRRSCVTEVEIVFTPWKPWSERKHIQGAEDQGVYLLAHFDAGTVPSGPASALDPCLIYIGETHGQKQTFLKRWGQFDRSARNGMHGHAGGCTYHEKFGAVSANLHVAAFSPKPSESRRCRSFFIRFVEAKLVWNFARTHDPDQLCNKH